MRFLFDKNAIIKRQKQIGSTNRYALSATATVEANIQQLDIETVGRIEGTFGEDYVLFCDPSTDIRDGDVVVEKETNNRYRVKEVLKGELMGIEHILEVYITKVKS